MRPARYPRRPAITAWRIAAAIRGGSLAREIAVLIKHASAPASIARAASDGLPIPASTTTGTCTRSTMRRTPSQSTTPWPEPIIEPRGIVGRRGGAAWGRVGGGGGRVAVEMRGGGGGGPIDRSRGRGAAAVDEGGGSASVHRPAGAGAAPTAAALCQAREHAQGLGI